MITQLTRITNIGGLDRYLGLPEHIGRKRNGVYSYVMQRVQHKMDSWYNRFLSQAGKEVLLKAVITALLTYTMSCFMLPHGLVKKITSAMCRFWWSSAKDRNRIPWVVWDKITESKKDGGIGIRDLKDFNVALLAKQVWRLMQCPSSLPARVFKATYLRNVSFLDGRCYPSSSYACKSLIQCQPLIKQESR